MIISPHDKADVRQLLLKRRRSIGAADRARWDLLIIKQLSMLLDDHSTAMLGVYWPIRGEPDLRAIYDHWAASGKQLALPVVMDKNAPLKFCAWSPGDALHKDGMGVMVPATAREVQPDILLLPCVGFNQARIRLGYGGGLYDRTLAAPARPLTIGVAYSCTEADFPAEAHDIALDRIVTEAAVIA